MSKGRKKAWNPEGEANSLENEAYARGMADAHKSTKGQVRYAKRESAKRWLALLEQVANASREVMED